MKKSTFAIASIHEECDKKTIFHHSLCFSWEMTTKQYYTSGLTLASLYTVILLFLIPCSRMNSKSPAARHDYFFCKIILISSHSEHYFFRIFILTSSYSNNYFFCKIILISSHSDHYFFCIFILTSSYSQKI
jgi:hypothetical protein